ncbi:zinc-binding dehydrogenase [Nonomuraea insulae]|uniref:Zinc-binding dehydrogenase n=1 Tax=Nonomuraea insulae TaxID=1616787 RepID=A0ABW1CMZ3_9ACTN
MRIVRVRAFGPPEVLRVEESETPRPGAGQVRVAVEVAGVGFGETIVRSGRYPLPLPYEPGIEVGGRVVELGAGADPTLMGRRVVATTLGNAGGYAESALAEAGFAFAVPDELSLDQAITVFQTGAVSLGMLSAMRVRAGETVLVTAAAGRIGTVLVQLARAAGARVIGAVGSADKAAIVRELGASFVADYGSPGWSEQVRKATEGRGVDVALDAIGGTVGAQTLEAAADGHGRIGLYGYASGTWTPLDTPTVVRRGLTVSGPLSATFAKPLDEQRADAEEALRAAAKGVVRTLVHATLPLADAARAHAVLESRESVGAVLLKP